jgi:3-hydroxyacyl-CoA dehydrogenase/3-hydroxy-2-methylbutyryl-CoA dehydrogenase
MNLKTSVALITGGGSGLGEATAREFASAGAKIVILDLPSSPGAKVAESIGADAIFTEADVTSGDQVSDAISEAAARFGGIHIAVNCAGIGRAMRTLSKEGPHSLDLFIKVITINLVGTFNVIRLAAEQMAKNAPGVDGERGVIICFSGGVRRPDRTGGILSLERRGGRYDAADRARPGLARDSGLHDRAGNFRDSDAGGTSGGGPQGARRGHSVSAATRQAV